MRFAFGVICPLCFVGAFLPVLGPFCTHLYSLDGAPNPFAIFWIVRGHPPMGELAFSDS